jgi:TPR repeat protein
MTQAVCFKCGEVKWGAFNRCGECQTIPRTDDELMLSLAFTDHHFEQDKLQQIGSEIKSGRTPKLADAWKEKLAPAVREAKVMLGIDRDAKIEAHPTLRRRILNVLRPTRVRTLFALMALIGLAAVASLWIADNQAQPRKSSYSIVDQFGLATSLYRGYDYDLVIGILRPIADAGDVNAQVNLANAAHSLGIRLTLRKDDPVDHPVEYRKEDYLKYLCLAALQDDAEAQNRLGWMAIDRNKTEAVSWWQNAAKLGNPDAQYEMVTIIHFGMYGLPKDDKKAFRMLQEAAEMGHDDAQFELADIYWDGKGNSDPPWTSGYQDYSEAAKWYLAAAKRGNSSAQEKIGLIYYRGMPLTQDFSEAYFWLSLAFANQIANRDKSYAGHLKAIKAMRDEAGSRLTTERLNHIQDLLKNWRASPSSRHDGLEWRDRPAVRRDERRITNDELFAGSACSSGAASPK